MNEIAIALSKIFLNESDDFNFVWKKAKRGAKQKFREQFPEVTQYDQHHDTFYLSLDKDKILKLLVGRISIDNLFSSFKDMEVRLAHSLVLNYRQEEFNAEVRRLKELNIQDSEFCPQKRSNELQISAENLMNFPILKHLEWSVFKEVRLMLLSELYKGRFNYALTCGRDVYQSAGLNFKNATL